ncbi:AAA family ATPase [Emcibacter sp. SYSU 3D8]|uniref:AAA family ATPase n=1 Tax=Emcibacter sp. SYSU 3D8 TaxID=3133969 RepID=UPI0031FEB13D
MQVWSVGIEGYRSVRRLRFPLRRLNVFIGENGVGKTNLYRGLQLVQAAASGTLTRELAAEGGMESALWAGPRKKNERARIKLRAELGAMGADYAYTAETGLVQQYEVGVGLRMPTGAGFLLEPQIKTESLAFVGGRRPVTMLERRGPHGFARDEEGKRHDLDEDLLPSETALGSLNHPGQFPDLHLVRAAMLGWRFYHAFRTDPASPLRHPCLAVTTPTLSSDASDLAAVFATLTHIREDTVDLDETVADAFPGARLIVPEPGQTASFGMTYAEFPNRVFGAAELSDGTLRFLALAGALLGYRLPPLVALNEPETSLHPDLLPPLGRLIARAAERTQVWVVTHSQILADTLESAAGVRPRRVYKRTGETLIDGITTLGEVDDEDE